MTARFHSSSPTERAFMTRKHWQHPGRREAIHGKVQPPDQPTLFAKLINHLKGRECEQ